MVWTGAGASSTSVIANNRISSNTENGVHLIASAGGCDGSANVVTVADNEIFDNGQAAILAVSGYSGFCISAFPPFGKVLGEITRNRIYRNGDGIRAASGYASYNAIDIANNALFENRGSGVSFVGNFESRVVNNTIVRNGGAGVAHDGHSATVANNVIVQNAKGVEALTASSATNIVFSFNDVWGNTTANWINHPPSFGNLTTVNANGTPSDASMNLSVDPRFMGQDDFHLRLDSPLIGAGTSTNAPATDFFLGRRGTRVDIGFDQARALPELTASREPSGAIKLTVLAEQGLDVIIEASSDLRNWQELTRAVNPTGRIDYTDTSSTASGHKFYRAKYKE